MKTGLSLALIACLAGVCNGGPFRLPSGYKLKYPPTTLPFDFIPDFYNETKIKIYTVVTWNGDQRKVLQCLYDYITELTQDAVYFIRSYWTLPRTPMNLYLKGTYMDRYINETLTVRNTSMLVSYTRAKASDVALLNLDVEYLIYLNRPNRSCGVFYMSLITPRANMLNDWCEVRVKDPEDSGQDCIPMYEQCRSALDDPREINQLRTRTCDLSRWPDKWK